MSLKDHHIPGLHFWDWKAAAMASAPDGSDPSTSAKRWGFTSMMSRVAEPNLSTSRLAITGPIPFTAPGGHAEPPRIPFSGGRNDRLVLFHLELTTIFGMIDPLAPHADGLTFIDGKEAPHHRHRVRPFCLQSHHRVIVVLIAVDYPFYLALQLRQCHPPFEIVANPALRPGLGRNFAWGGDLSSSRA